MARRKLFVYLASASGYIGLGLLLGYALSDQVTTTPLWIGVILTLLGAILLGMFISAREDTAPGNTKIPIEQLPQNPNTRPEDEIR